MNFTTGSALLELCKGESLSIGQVMLRRESSVSQRSEEDLFQQMARSYEIMKQSAKGAFSPLSSPLGGLIGGESAKLNAYVQSHIPVCGPVVARAISYAMGVLEVNASMGLIVAAPTAGSSGVIPGVYLAVQEEFSLEDRDMTSALFTAGAVGYLITRNATCLLYTSTDRPPEISITVDSIAHFSFRCNHLRRFFRLTPTTPPREAEIKSRVSRKKSSASSPTSCTAVPAMSRTKNSSSPVPAPIINPFSPASFALTPPPTKEPMHSAAIAIGVSTPWGRLLLLSSREKSMRMPTIATTPATVPKASGFHKSTMPDVSALRLATATVITPAIL